MYLLNIETLKLEAFNNRRTVPRYGILSHTWGEEEIIYSDLQEYPHLAEIRDLKVRLKALETPGMKARFQALKIGSDGVSRDNRPKQKGGEDHEENDSRLWRVRQKKGWSKVDGCCKEASMHGLSYVWIDTCCINKDSSAELSEAINSMFAWYRDAAVCFAYLSDVNHDWQGSKSFYTSRWFSRGWTLQELIAPKDVLFFCEDWTFMFTRSSSAHVIAKITGIDAKILGSKGLGALSKSCVATRMAWASHRLTTREEDSAYALMGLFGVNMPIIYGEGKEAAFFRLQREIFGVTGDHSIFAWYSGNLLGDMVHYKDLDQYLRAITDRISFKTHDDPPRNLFTLSPSQVGFARSVSSVPYNFKHLVLSKPASDSSTDSVQYSAASHGLRVQLILQPLTPDISIDAAHPVIASFYLAHLACKVKSEGQSGRLGIILVSQERGSYQRPSPVELVLIDEPIPKTSGLILEDVYVTMPQSRLANSIVNDEFQNAESVFPTQIRLIDEQFHDCGFTLKDFAPSSRQMYTQPSGYIVSSSNEFNIVQDWTVVNFNHPSTTETFAVGFYLYSAAIQVDTGSSIALDIWKKVRNERSKYLTVNDLRKELFITQLPGGRTLFLSVKSDANQRYSFNILVKGRFSPKEA